MSCDEVLISLQIISGSVAIDQDSPKSEKPRLPKIEFRSFETGKGNPKLWFEQLEIVFKTMAVTSTDQKFAGLLRLLDETTSSLLAAITRSKSDHAYEESKT
ncbi:Hypothetical predicted protein, partial [Paramuricea clavata]